MKQIQEKRRRRRNRKDDTSESELKHSKAIWVAGIMYEVQSNGNTIELDNALSIAEKAYNYARGSDISLWKVFKRSGQKFLMRRRAVADGDVRKQTIEAFRQKLNHVVA